jgi:hypothetical protein
LQSNSINSKSSIKLQLHSPKILYTNNVSIVIMSFMYTDPRSVDKLLAKELNSLSFDDREALSEQLHGVRSLAPKETPEMLNNAFHELQNEINKTITKLLMQLPSSSSSSGQGSGSGTDNVNNRSGSGQPSAAAAAGSSSYDDVSMSSSSSSAVLPNIINSSSTIFSSLTSTNSGTRNSSNIRLRREYLTGILSSSFTSPGEEESTMRMPMSSTTMPSSSSSMSTSSSSSASASASSDTYNNNSESENENENMNMDTSNNNSTNESNNNNNNNNKYSYVRSYLFCIKFLRSELFDVKKAADRYMQCIDFLVDYFGLFALERPLFLNDLNKEEHKLLKEGQLQLLPSRDRSGRRVVVFLGTFGYGYTQMNRFRVGMYIIGQVASDDECTQKNGLVCIYSRHSTTLREVVEYASHQTECIRFVASLPVRYSAFHCFLPDDIIKGMMLNMIGKRTRLVTRIHTGTLVRFAYLFFGVVFSSYLFISCLFVVCTIIIAFD